MTILPLMTGWHDYMILKGSFKCKPFNDSTTLILVVHHCSNFQKTSAFWNIAVEKKKRKYCSKCFPWGAVMVWVSQKTRFMTHVSGWKPLKCKLCAGCGFEEEQGLSVLPFLVLRLFHLSDFLLLTHIMQQILCPLATAKSPLKVHTVAYKPGNIFLWSHWKVYK